MTRPYVTYHKKYSRFAKTIKRLYDKKCSILFVWIKQKKNYKIPFCEINEQ